MFYFILSEKQETLNVLIKAAMPIKERDYSMEAAFTIARLDTQKVTCVYKKDDEIGIVFPKYDLGIQNSSYQSI